MPFRNQIHVDTLLSDVSVKYKNEEYIADSVFPVLPVQKDSDLYRIYVRNFRIPETLRANRGEANESDFQVTTATYNLEKHALKAYVSDADKANYDAAELLADTVEDLTDTILRRKELHVASLFTTTSWSLNVSLAAASAWNQNTTTSNPIPVMDTGATTVILNSGYKPNYAIINREGFVAIKQHTSILDRIKYTSSDVTANMIAGLFEVPELLISTASRDTAAEGATEAISAIWGDVAFLGYKPPRASPMKPSAGYTFMKARPMVKRWRVEERESECVEVNVELQAKVVASLSGYLIKDIV